MRWISGAIGGLGSYIWIILPYIAIKCLIIGIRENSNLFLNISIIAFTVMFGVIVFYDY